MASHITCFVKSADARRYALKITTRASLRLKQKLKTNQKWRDYIPPYVTFTNVKL